MSDPENGKRTTEDKTPAVKSAPVRRRILVKDEELIHYKHMHLIALYANLLVAIVGFVVVLISLDRNTQSVRANVQNGVTSQIAGLSKVFMDEPELYPYFFDGREAPPKQPCVPHNSTHTACYDKLRAVAMYKADVMDIVATQRTHFPHMWDDPEAWDVWVKDSMRSSPILQQYLQENCRWYGKTLIKDLQQALLPLQEKLPEEKKFPPDCQKYLNEK
jgi:hypothetical protein